MFTKQDIQTVNGAKIILQTLKALNVDTIFGYPGGIVLELYDELYKQKDICHILVRHEQSAVHAAEGYARTTGKCGVVLVTSGPGATNTVTGIANAYLDGYPLIVITGQVLKKHIGTDAFQEANICDITKSCTKKVFQVNDANNIQDVIIEAFKIANSGKKGPVVIDITKDVFSQKTQYKNQFEGQKTQEISNHHNINYVLERILKSKKPLIVSGGGVVHANAYNELLEFSNKTGIPVVSTMMGVGTFPQNHKNYFGMIGIYGDNSANEILRQSDLILSLGARFNDRITCMFDIEELSSKFIQIDINKNEIARSIMPIEFIIGDAKQVLDDLNKISEKFVNNWANCVQNLKKLNNFNKKNSNMLSSCEIIKRIDELTEDKNVIFTSEVGQHQLFAIKNLTLNRKRKILLSGGSGTMGFGFAAAIGASVANPDKTIVCITGDGSFQMGLNELATCKDYNLNIKIIILNNGYLGMVRQLQEKKCEGRYSQTKISNPNFVNLAQSYNIDAAEVLTLTDLDAALKKALSTKETFLINCKIEPSEII